MIPMILTVTDGAWIITATITVVGEDIILQEANPELTQSRNELNSEDM